MADKNRVSILKNTVPDGMPRGTWERANNSTVFMCCPECERISVLGDHTIADNGDISPSVVCPYEGCNWHVWVNLEGYAD